MNVHTVEISTLLGPDQIRRLCRSQQHWFRFPGRDGLNRYWPDITEFVNASSDAPQQSCRLHSEMYPVDGVREATLIPNPSIRGYFYFVIVVNLECLYRQEMTILSFPCTVERIQHCSNVFRALMADNFHGVGFGEFLEWSVSRIDYTVDVVYPDHTPLYIVLARRGRIPRDMEPREKYSGSCYLELSSGDVVVHFYDKENQLRERGFHDGDRLMEEAHGLLRLEVRCQGQKLDHIRDMIRERNLPHYGMELRTFLNAEISNAVVQEYYAGTIGYLDYYDLDSADRHLQEQRGKRDMKARLLLFLRQVDQAGSVTAAIDAYHQRIMPDGSPALITGPESSLHNLLNVYPLRFGVNPVVIPDSYEVDYLPNPMPVHLRRNR